jgi:hypothetical protein
MSVSTVSTVNSNVAPSVERTAEILADQKREAAAQSARRIAIPHNLKAVMDPNGRGYVTAFVRALPYVDSTLVMATDCKAAVVGVVPGEISAPALIPGDSLRADTTFEVVDGQVWRRGKKYEYTRVEQGMGRFPSVPSILADFPTKNRIDVTITPRRLSNLLLAMDALNGSSTVTISIDKSDPEKTILLVGEKCIGLLCPCGSAERDTAAAVETWLNRLNSSLPQSERVQQKPAKRARSTSAAPKPVDASTDTDSTVSAVESAAV